MIHSDISLREKYDNLYNQLDDVVDQFERCNVWWVSKVKGCHEEITFYVTMDNLEIQHTYTAMGLCQMRFMGFVLCNKIDWMLKQLQEHK